MWYGKTEGAGRMYRDADMRDGKGGGRKHLLKKRGKTRKLIRGGRKAINHRGRKGGKRVEGLPRHQK